MEHSARHTVIFTVLLCVVFSVLVSSVATSLKDRQDRNATLDRIKNVLTVAGLRESDESLSGDEIMSRFESGLVARAVELSSGRYVDEIDALQFDQRKAAKDPEQSREAPTNPAKVRRLPDHAVVYLIQEAGETVGVVVPIEGYGLWSTLYGYLALGPDGNTIRGITYYSHGETAGLGGEVDNPNWKAKWPGRQAFDAKGKPAIRVKKGAAGPPADDPFQVDGLSGATITSTGVTNMLEFWLGRNGFGPYLKKFKQEGQG